MKDTPSPSFLQRLPRLFADFIVGHAGAVLVSLLVLGAAATWAASRLTINSNQLDLISQELPEVKAVHRVIDMVGGTGHFIVALRSADTDQMKKVSDDLAAMLRADTEYVRTLNYKMPVEFAQQNMVLFVATEDLLEGKQRIMRFLRDRLRRANPFFVELKKTEPVVLDLSDLIAKYSSIGKKSIADDYYISNDRKMQLLIIKPMWDSNNLARTAELVDRIRERFAAYSTKNDHGVRLVEDYDLMGSTGTVAYGFTGSYKTNVDDSYAMTESLEPVTLLAFFAVLIVTAIFFRRIAPALIVMTGTVLGTLFAMGFAYATLGQLNMITSILGGLLMGFGVDYGIHFTFRTRIELGLGKPLTTAVRDAIELAGRPAAMTAIVTAASFFVLLVSEFRGFSQFGLLAGFGTLIIAVTLFSFCPAVLVLLDRKRPGLAERLIGRMDPFHDATGHEGGRIPAPKRLLVVGSAVLAFLCLAALPLTEAPSDGAPSTLLQRALSGVRFNYNTRALMPRGQSSVKLQDEIAQRFAISADPTAIFTTTVEEAREVWDELTGHPEKYPTIDQVVSIYSFVPPAERAQKNAEVLAQWRDELEGFDLASLAPEMEKHRVLIDKVLNAKPFGVDGVPELYAKQFKSLPTAKPENQGYLTFLYPNVDLWDGAKLMQFAAQTSVIKTASGREYRAAGLPPLYAKLASIVLWDGKVTVVLVGVLLLLLQLADFRSPLLAAVAVIPLLLGFVAMLGIMALADYRLNFMNIVMLPILLGFGVAHGQYLLHRYLEGTSPLVAMRSVGAAVASSTLTTIVAFASLFIASHHGLRSMGLVASLGLATTLIVSFTMLAAVLQLLHDRRS